MAHVFRPYKRLISTKMSEITLKGEEKPSGFM
jgi:hypothetical protein